MIKNISTMAKQSKGTNYTEFFQNLDPQLSKLLEKCNNGNSVGTLCSEERTNLWMCLLNLIKTNTAENLTKENVKNLKNCIDFACTVLHNNSLSFDIKLELLDLVKYLNDDEFLVEEPLLLNSKSKMNEYWMVKMAGEDIPGMEYFTLKHLLNLCTAEKILMTDIQRLSAIRKHITAAPLDRAVPSLRPLLIKLVQRLQILSSESGQRFIAQALNLSNKIMNEIHKTIMLDLSSCNKKKAACYGKIYIMAWHAGSEEMKKQLEKTCFQHLMETMLKEQRTSLELNKSSHNILAVLEVWHAERKKKNPHFITMITNAYQPILWKHLQSGFNVHRCNATDVFFKAFPLQRSEDNAIEAEKLFSLQYETMLSSLTDDCHIVRIIGIREVCNILSVYWNSFSPLQIQNLMSVITKQNAYDASTAEVRRMVYIGLQSLIKSPLSSDYVKQILPNLANNIHDVNQRVRIAFIQLLICVKEKKDSNFKYSDIVSMFNIQYRLAEDNIAVGQWIVKLLMRNYYHSKMPVVEWTKRFIYLIKTYRASYRNFFFYSSKSLPFLDACTIIYEILTQLGLYVISNLGSDQENNENLVEKPKEKKKGNKKVPLSDWNASNNSSNLSENSGGSKKCAFDDPDVVTGLFDIVTILWVLHDVKLNKPENEEVKLKLYDTYIKYAQPFISYYKDCNLFMGVLTLSGNIPASLLRSNSITLPGYCIKMLKSMKVDYSEEDNEKVASILIALVKWGRGSEILEQVTLWLDAAFETQDMNETILPRRRVKINESQPNSVVAINVLDTLMKKEYVKLSILKKNYKELFNLWKFMSRIKKLIETRLDQGEPFEENLVSDEFIILCFRRFIKLIPLLKEKSKEEVENQSPNESMEVSINHQKEIENIIEWAENSLFPLLQQEDLEEDDVDLITSLIEDILYVSDNMIIVHLVNNFFHFKTAHLVLKLLATKYGVRFVKAASRITVAINYSAKLLFKVKDDLQIFSTVIPSLLSHTLNVLTHRQMTPKDIAKLEKDIPVIKTSVWKVILTFQDNLKSSSGLKENVRQLKLVVGFFVDCIVTIISQEIPREDSSIPLYSTPSQLPPISSSLITLFHNKKTWTPLFLHVINSKLSNKSYDIKSTVATILLLHLYSVSDKKANKLDIKKSLDSASRCLNKFKEVMKTRKEDTVETETTTKKTWPSNVATRGYSSTWTGNISKETVENASKEAVEGDEDEEDRIVVPEKSVNLTSFHTEGNNLEGDLIECGLELVKNIENTLETNTAQPMDAS